MLTYFTWVESFKKLDFGAGSALAVIIALGSLAVILVLVRAIPKGALVEERAMSKRSPLRRVIIYGGALLLALFWFAPFVLVVIGSVLPEVNLLSFPPTLVRRPAQPADLRLHLHRQDPGELRAARGAAQHDLQRGARRAARHPQQPRGRHRGDAHQRRSSAAWRRTPTPASAFPGARRAFNFVLMSRLIPTVAIAVPYYLIVQALRADQHLLGADRRSTRC